MHGSTVRTHAHAALAARRALARGTAPFSAGPVPQPPQASPRTQHVLLGDVVDPAPTSSAGPGGLSPSEQANRILASLLPGDGPVLLCLPGTTGAAFQSSMLTTARSFLAEMRGRPAAVVSIPYRNGIGNAVGRFFGVGTRRSQSVLALVIRGLQRHAPHRPILIVGESQGAWLAAQDLHDPVLAGAVTRVVLFAKPGFQQLPVPIGEAVWGASMLPGPTGLLEVRHVDDIVPSLFWRLGMPVARSYVDSFRAWGQTGEYDYPPHHYGAHGAEAAAFLARGVRPARPVHDSHDDRR